MSKTTHTLNPPDIKAEVLAADAVEHGFDLEKVLVKPVGVFKRPYRRDVISRELKEDFVNEQELLHIEVSREGLYDTLPEGFFHQPAAVNVSKSTNDVISDIHRQEKEEKEARLFFSPIEKELYRQRILLEMEERKSMVGFSEHYKTDLFSNLWSELQDIDEDYVSALIHVLPIAYKVVGNLELTALTFEKILGEKVAIRIVNNKVVEPQDTLQSRLGETEIGVDFALGSGFVDYHSTLEILIGPLSKHQLMDYLPNGKAAKVIEVMCTYLTPVEANIITTVLLKNTEQSLLLSTNQFDGRLGYTSEI